MPDFASWDDRGVDSRLGRCLFSFVLIADTHVDRENEPSSSPFPVNQLSNARTRYCVEDMRSLQGEMGRLAPRFAVHLGDLIHPVPSMPSYAKAADDFHAIVADLDMPLYVLPGNHDVGDKPVDWAPAGVVRDEFLDLWEKHFGVQYQAFSHEGIRFVLANAQIINSGLDVERRQREWLEKELSEHAGGRVMLFLHYPPYLAFADEPENYDNLAEPGRSWITGLVEAHGVEAMFAGHVHHFWYHRHARTDFYLLPSTSFTRQDYSEMFRAAPPPDMQDGRNDADKVGYFIVLIYENGHVCHFRRTGGGVLEAGERLDGEATGPAVIPIHPREAIGHMVGFDLRHPWAELTDIAPSGALDEFRRKRVRNDYPLMALWQMGVAKVRIPAEDLAEDRVVDRMRALSEMGHEFVVVSQGVPSPEVGRAMIAHQDLVTRWEVVLPTAGVAGASAAVSELASGASFDVYLSKLRMKSDVVREGEPYFHLISHGFSPADEDEIKSLLGGFGPGGVFSGVVCRVGRGERPGEVIPVIAEACARSGMPASVTMFMADANPALHRCDDLDNANHIAEGIFAAAAVNGVELFVDTFMDMDRGHSVRNGVIDRMCNPRMAMFVVRNLYAIMASDTKRQGPLERGLLDRGRWLGRRRGEGRSLLLMPSAPSREYFMQDGESDWPLEEAVDLVTGSIQAVKVDASRTGARLLFDRELTGPAILYSGSRGR